MAWPTTDDPRTEFVTLRLTVGESSTLDALATDQGVSRSALLRMAVEEFIESRRA